MANKVLVVDDEKLIVKGLKFSLEQDGMQVECAYDGEEALECARKNSYDMILLDIMLPKMDGMEVCQQIREFSDVPIIMLTAKGEDMDKILGLEYGADDYITKPFEIKEVIARITVQLRHSEKYTNDSEVLQHKDIVLNKQDFSVTVLGEKLPKVTKQEYSILELLVRNPKRVFTKEEIFEYAWDEQYMGETKTLDVHISNIRKKLKAVSDIEFIETIWGIGYKLY